MISVILPTLNRPKLLQRALDNLTLTADLPIEIIVILDNNDLVSQAIVHEYPDKVKFLIGEPQYSVPKWNKGAKVANYDWLLLASDDILLPNFWPSKFLATINSGFIAIPDQHRYFDNFYQPFFLVTKDWCRKYQGGVFVVPHYKSWGIDPEACSRARKSNTYAITMNNVIHNHAIWGLSAMDDTYARGKEFWKSDIDLFHKRSEQGFPNDFEGFL